MGSHRRRTSADEDDEDEDEDEDGGKGPQNTEEEEQVLVMNSERFAVPEVLFCPAQIGELDFLRGREKRERRTGRLIAIRPHASTPAPTHTTHTQNTDLDQAGLAELVESSINAVADEDLRGLLWGNVVLVGGGAKLAGIKRRL